MKPMNEYEFSIVIRDADFSAPNLHDLLFENGCDDALICANNNTVYLQFTREANSAQEAILSALSNINDAGFKDLIIEESNAITISEIASKAELTRQAIHNYVKGHRGDRNFPKPIAGLSSNNPLYDWYEVAQWLNNHDALSNESLEVALVAKYFNFNTATDRHLEMAKSLRHHLPMDPIYISPRGTMNRGIGNILPRIHVGPVQLIEENVTTSMDDLSAALAEAYFGTSSEDVKLLNVSASPIFGTFGKKLRLSGDIHEVFTLGADNEELQNLACTPLRR